jgi:hypothetical protein
MRAGEDFTHHAVHVVTSILSFFPLSWIAQTNFLKPHAVNPICPTDVQVASDNDLGVVLRMPVGGLFGSAPEGEARDLGDEDGVLSEWPVIDNDER